jgi:cell division protein FtsL
MNLSTLGIVLVLAAGPLVASADEMDNAYQNLKQAVAQKDPAQVQKLAQQAFELPRKAEAEPTPPQADLKMAWSQRIADAKDVEAYTEYALYATAVQSPPQALVQLFSALEQQNPKSKYLNDGYGAYFAALNSTGAAARIPAIAERAVRNFPENEELLAVVANTALTPKENDRALALANRLIAACKSPSRPASVPAAAWERERGVLLGRGYWIAGVILGEQGAYALSDRDLRDALPLIKGEQGMMAPALFYLGVDNYQLGRMALDKAKVLEGAKFSQEAAAIQGPYQEQAWKNAWIMKDEAGRMR